MTIPPALAAAVDEDDDPTRRPWLAGLAGQIEAIAAEWELEVGDPYLPGGHCAWVATARGAVTDGHRRAVAGAVHARAPAQTLGP